MMKVKMNELYRSLAEEGFVGDNIDLAKRVKEVGREYYVTDSFLLLASNKKLDLWDRLVHRLSDISSFEGNKTLLEDVVYDSAAAYEDQILDNEEYVADILYMFLSHLIDKADVGGQYAIDIVVDKWLYGAIKSFTYPGPIGIKGFVNEFHAHEINKYYGDIPYLSFLSKYTKWKRGELAID